MHLAQKVAELQVDLVEWKFKYQHDLEVALKTLDNEQKAKALYQISLTVLLCLLTSLFFLRLIAHYMDFGVMNPV